MRMNIKHGQKNLVFFSKVTAAAINKHAFIILKIVCDTKCTYAANNQIPRRFTGERNPGSTQQNVTHTVTLFCTQATLQKIKWNFTNILSNRLTHNGTKSDI